MALSLPEFVARWQASKLTERSASQSHFIDLCDVLGQPHPVAADQTGSFYTFEKGVKQTSGGQGFADVWLSGRFGWEYKKKRSNLADAYKQLLQYREDLDNPPLLVVCDLDRFEIHTQFLGIAKRVYAFELADLLSPDPVAGTHGIAPLAILRALFTDPDALKPEQTTAHVTEQAASEFARLANGLRARGEDPEAAAHFLMRLLFCLFAEDVGLLPSRLFTRLVEQTVSRPSAFQERVRLLFEAMATGGSFGVEDIRHFNGGLFTDDTALFLDAGDLAVLRRAASLDWASVEPAIFGTLFERSLDPSKRAQLGAHYTSREDILLIIEPVLMAPLRRRWQSVKSTAAAMIAKRDEAVKQAATARAQTLAGFRRTRNEQQDALNALIRDFIGEISGVRVLDPACGSGNFLYVALKSLLDLEKEVITFAASNGLTAAFPHVQPGQLRGIEVSAYAHELASIVVWIGYIQWLRDNGFGYPEPPILRRLDTIHQMDAILAYDDERRPLEPPWPDADVIVGNPPFLGVRRLRTELGDTQVDALFRLYEGRVPHEADLVAYWFERTRALIACGSLKRAGLLATQAIRMGANRRVLERIKASGDIFMAWRDRPWILDGAAVRVSMVGFDDGTETARTVDGEAVPEIHADLTAAHDLTLAKRIPENGSLCFQGANRLGPFDIDVSHAGHMLRAVGNPNGKSNADVVRPTLNGSDLARRPRDQWIIDFRDMALPEAALYELPFEYVRKHVKPLRDNNKRPRRRDYWWQHGETVPGMRKALEPLSRFIATAAVMKHRTFVWVDRAVLPDHRLFVFAREDDYFFGVLHSRVHEAWSLATSSRHGVGNDPTYNNTTCFETFPLPWPPGTEPHADARVEAIAVAARDLVTKRDRWLNPPDATEALLKTRTLTALYNERPTWLTLAHQALDSAVLDAYGWPRDLDPDAILERVLALNLERAATGAGADA